MSTNDHMPFLLARLEGEAIGAGRIPVSHLLVLLKDLNKAFYRSGLVMAGAADGVRRGTQPTGINDEIGLDLVLLTHGIKMADIQRLEDQEDAQAELLPVGTSLPTDFWTSPTIEELAQAQGVEPLTDVTSLFGTWPGDANDGFEDSIRALRDERGLEYRIGND